MVDTEHSMSATYMTGVRILNTGSTVYKDKYNNTEYKIEPGSEAFIPFDAACLWLGDPRLFDVGKAKNEKHRTDEFHRIMYRVGANEADEEHFEEIRPSLEVYGLDGERYIMVADDPYGPGQDVFKNGGGEETPEQRIARLESLVQLMIENGAVPGGGVDSQLEELGIGNVDEAKPVVNTPGNVLSKPGDTNANSSPKPAIAGLPPKDGPNLTPKVGE